MGGWHVVKQGEWLTNIAAQYNITDWKTKIWDHPSNSDLAQRRDPNVLHPGDRIFIPEIAPKEISCATDCTHLFVLRKVYDEFSLRLLDSDDKPIRHTPYTLSIGQQTFRGQTDGSGEIHQQRIDPSGDHHGVLDLPSLGLRFAVGVGDLNPVQETVPRDHTGYDNGISGLLMRLRNLGYGPEQVPTHITCEDHLPSACRDAILTFQCVEMGLSGESLTGTLTSETRAALLAKWAS